MFTTFMIISLDEENQIRSHHNRDQKVWLGSHVFEYIKNASVQMPQVVHIDKANSSTRRIKPVGSDNKEPATCRELT